MERRKFIEGRLLNGKYASRRSAGNYLAGMNAAGKGYSLDKTMQVFGAYQQAGKMGIVQNLLFGKTYGEPPYYGEQPYSGRMQILGHQSRTRRGDK